MQVACRISWIFCSDLWYANQSCAIWAEQSIHGEFRVEKQRSGDVCRCLHIHKCILDFKVKDRCSSRPLRGAIPKPLHWLTNFTQAFSQEFSTVKFGLGGLIMDTFLHVQFLQMFFKITPITSRKQRLQKWFIHAYYRLKRATWEHWLQRAFDNA